MGKLRNCSPPFDESIFKWVNPLILVYMDNNVSEKELNDYQVRMTDVIGNMVEYLRNLLLSRSKDFVLFRLDEIAKESQMEDSLKECIKKALDEPEKPFNIKFKPNL